MKDETKGKAAVVLIVSFIAFGFGTGVSIFFPSISFGNSSYSSNISIPSDLPPVFNVDNTTETNQTTVETPTNSNNEDVYEEKTSETTNSQTNQNKTKTNTNKTGP